MCWGQNILGEQGQYHGCWCHGSLCHQAINDHDIDCIGWTDPCLPSGSISPTYTILVSICDRKCKDVFMFLQNISAHKGWILSRFYSMIPFGVLWCCFPDTMCQVSHSSVLWMLTSWIFQPSFWTPGVDQLLLQPLVAKQGANVCAQAWGYWYISYIFRSWSDCGFVMPYGDIDLGQH